MFRVTLVNDRPNSSLKKEYIVSDISDIEKLPRVGIRGTMHDPTDKNADDPCAYGSTALLINNGILENYILMPTNEWVKYTQSQSNGGSGSGSGSGGNTSGSDDGFIEL